MADDPKPPEPPPIPDLGKLVDAALAKHGDQTSALKAIIADNYALRDDLKAAREKAPRDGSVVLTGDDAKAWGAYSQLGKPSDLRKVVDEHGTLAGKVATYERDESLRGVADKAGVRFAVLKTLAAPGLAFETKPVKDPKTNRDVETVHVRDGEAAPVPFDDYARDHWADFLPALKPAAPAGPPPRPPGTPARTDLHRHEPPPARPEAIRHELMKQGIGSF